MNNITKQQYDRLQLYQSCGTKESFNDLLYCLCGITARPCTMYDYYDEAGNYIGNSNDSVVLDLLRGAGVRVVDGDEND